MSSTESSSTEPRSLTDASKRAWTFVDPRYGILTAFGAAGWQSLAGNLDAATAFAEVGVLLAMIITLGPSVKRLSDWVDGNSVSWKSVDPVFVFVLTVLATVLVTMLAFFLSGVKLWSVIP